MQISGTWRLISRVFLPFAAGYYLSYLYRTINALIASHLSSDTALGTADLGLLTSVYFLSVYCWIALVRVASRVFCSC
jgi:sugar phosphate permease